MTEAKFVQIMKKENEEFNRKLSSVILNYDGALYIAQTMRATARALEELCEVYELEKRKK